MECSDEDHSENAINDNSITSRLSKLEEIYQKKIEIYDKRVVDLEDENLYL